MPCTILIRFSSINFEGSVAKTVLISKLGHISEFLRFSVVIYKASESPNHSV
jgi:hypothetical protein